VTVTASNPVTADEALVMLNAELARAGAALPYGKGIVSQD